MENLKIGRELDIVMARDVLGHSVEKNKKFGYVETTPLGVRPMKKYSKDIEAAWEIALHLGVTLLPIQDGTWFAMIGPDKGWESPAQFYKYMQDAKFMKSGAAVSETAPLAICLAAYQAVNRRQVEAEKLRVVTSEDVPMAEGADEITDVPADETTPPDVTLQ